MKKCKYTVHLTRRWAAYLELHPVSVILLPKPVDHMDLDEMADVLIKSGHEEVHVVEVVEFPALGNQRVAQDVLERDCVFVQIEG